MTELCKWRCRICEESRSAMANELLDDEGRGR